MDAVLAWRGDAVAVAQVVIVTPGDVVAGRDYTLRINSKDITCQGSTAEALVDAFVDAINASSIAEWREVVATSSADDETEYGTFDGDVALILTSREAGVPFTVTGLVAGFEQRAAIVITIWHTPTGGTWVFDAGDVDTGGYGEATLDYNDSVTDIQTAMDGLFGAGNTLVSRRNYASPARAVYTIEFIGSMAGKPVIPVTVDGSSLTGGDAVLQIDTIQTFVAGTSEVQTITLYGSATGGTFRFRFRGAYVDLAYNVSPADMQTAIRAVATINGANVDVTGTAGTSYVLTFKNALAHQALDAVEIDTANLTGGTIYADIAVTTPGMDGLNEVQYIVQECGLSTDEIVSIERSGTVSGGTFKLTYASGGGGVESDPIDWDAPLYEILEKMEAMLLAGQGLTYCGPYFVGETNPNENISDTGGTLLIRLVGNAGGGNQLDGSGVVARAIGIDGTALTGGGSYACPGPSSSNGSTNGQTRATTGTFRMRVGFSSNYTSLLTLAVGTGGVITSPTLAEAQAALESLPEVGEGNVLLEAMPTTTSSLNSGRSLWKATFRNGKAGTAMGLINGLVTPGTITTGSPWSPVGYRVRGGVAGTTEVQTLTVHGTPSAGSLKLGFTGGTTAAIAYNAPAIGVESALVALPQFNLGDIAATGGVLGTAPVALTFGGQYTYTDVPTITVDDNLLKVGVARTTPGVTGQNEIQRLSLVGQNVRAGTVTLTIEGDTVDPIDYNADLATIVETLETSSGLTAGDLSESYGGPLPENAVFIVFGGSVAESNVDVITATDDLTNAYASKVAYDPLIVRKVINATGPNHFNEPVNWYNAANPSIVRAPERGDTLLWTEGNVDVLYGGVLILTYTADATNDLIVVNKQHDLREGQAVEVWSIGGTPPAGLAANTTYYVVQLDSVTGNFALATTATGDPIDISGSGTGVHWIGVRLQKFVQWSYYTGRMGLPWANADYKEYRPLDLEFGLLPAGAKLVTIGQGTGNGSGRISLYTGPDQVTIDCVNSAGSADRTRPAVVWRGENAASAVKLLGGDLGIAVRPTESAVFTSLEQRGGSISCGADVEADTWDKTGGSIGVMETINFGGAIVIRG